jgi:hypothetical protein
LLGDIWRSHRRVSWYSSLPAFYAIS